MIPLGIAVFSLLSTAPTVAATTKTKSPYWEGSRKADACLAAKDYYDTRAQKGHFETGDVGGLFTPNCTKVVFSGDHQEFASVVFEVRNGVERWNADVELKKR